MFDLIIIGGGLVGSGLALSLQDLGLKIALIDARLPSQDDKRLFALNHGSCLFLQNLKLWPQLSPYAAPIHQVQVSRRGYFGNVRLKREAVGLEALGYVVPAGRIEAAMQKSLRNISVFQPATLIALAQDDETTTVTLHTNEKLQAPIVIGADGTHSTVRKLLGIESDIYDYQQTAIVTITQLRRSHANCAYERFVEHGAIAMLPLPEKQCATIWTTDNSYAQTLLRLDDVNFLQRLQDEFGYRLGKLASVSPRFSYPLQMQQAKKSVHSNVFLLGNANHTLHPIAAQGFNLALYEVAVLVEGIIEKGGKITAKDLALINEKTQKQQSLGLSLSHRLARVFEHGSLINNLSFQLGMLGLDIAAPLKRKFINDMMGRTGVVPSLLLGEHGL